jgi:hypothetical protein
VLICFSEIRAGGRIGRPAAIFDRYNLAFDRTGLFEALLEGLDKRTDFVSCQAANKAYS